MDIPRLILSSRSFFDAEAHEDRPVGEVLDRAAAAGIDGLVSLADERVMKALRERKGIAPVRFLPIVPNVPGIVRQMTRYGAAGAGIRRLLRVGVVGSLRLGMFGATKVTKVLKRDFPTLLTVLCELEMNEVRKFDPPVVFLHHQMTDLMLGFDNARAFTLYADLIRKRYGREPGLVTSNLVRLTERLEAWGIDIRVIAAPVNRAGHLMPGTDGVKGIETYRAPLASGRFHVVADRISVEPVTPSEDRDWALAQEGIVAAVVDV